jgi:hypothetical protein
MRALAIDPVMCGRDGADTTVELTFVQLKKARPNRKRIGRIDGMPIRDADVPRIAPITPTRELRVLRSSRPVWAAMTLCGAQGTFARLRLPPACGALRLPRMRLPQSPQWPLTAWPAAVRLTVLVALWATP